MTRETPATTARNAPSRPDDAQPASPDAGAPEALLTAEERAAMRGRHQVVPCSCAGRRWVNDENWSPSYPESWDGTRSRGDGLIPCGSCNPGGWDVEPGAPMALTCDEDFQPWPCDAIRLLDVVDAVVEALERAGP